MQESGTTSARQFALEWSLLAYSSIITLLITLAPFRFRWPSSVEVIYVGPVFDIVANILLFVPPGFLYWLTRRPRPDASTARVFWLGFALSSGIEISQIFQPGRYPSPADVVANALGAWIGAQLCARVSQLLNRQWIGRLGLELPLMNIVYLLVPLIWLDGLAAGSDSPRSYLTWVLGFSGAVVIAGVYRFGLKHPSIVKPYVLALAAAGWFLAASLPTFLNLGAMPLVGCAAVAVTTFALVQLPVFGHATERRFEFRVLKRVWPVYAAYLLVLLAWPLPDHLTRWRVGLGFLELADDPPIVIVLRLLEHFSAFTLLGYMVAESHGRREISQARSIAWTCCWCGVAAAGLEILRGFHPDHTASAAQGGLLLIGSAYGGWIYWRQLSRIQALHGPDPLSRLAPQAPGATAISEPERPVAPPRQPGSGEA
jgi:VanZ family protein